MIKTKHILFIFCLISSFVLNAQTFDIEGKVIANEDIESIHIINKTASKFTITNVRGEFVIPAKLNDTIIISAVKYKPEEVVVTQAIVNSKKITVYLTENVNQLDQVVVGKVLTGDLGSDIKNSDAKRDINFYDVGIPGYTGKRKTQTERRLFDADGGSYISSVGSNNLGLGMGINFYKILNKITGRTKKLKEHVRLEHQDNCMNATKSELSELLFKQNELDETYRVEFFYFASEDEKFMQLCKINNDFQMFEFLKQKLIDYKLNLETSKD